MTNGDKGDTGNPGPGNALMIGTVQSGSDAAATITGNSPSQILNLVLPKGDKGDKGDTGQDGYTPVKGTDYFTDQDIEQVRSGLQEEITSENKLPSDLVDDTSQNNKFVTTSEKQTWNAKYNKPSGGIPKADLSSEVQSSLDKADTALQEHQDISGKEDKSNKVTSLSSSSTDTQYPSAKCVYDLVGNIESILETLDIGGGIE